jgi:hypothetical protein
MVWQCRTVEFVVVSETRSGEQLISEIGMEPDEVRSGSGRFAHKVSWVARTAGDGESDLSGLIEDLLARIQPSIDKIERVMKTSHDVAVLRVIQHVGDDPVGPGFSLSPSAIETLARVKAMLDVDQYLVAETTVDG